MPAAQRTPVIGRASIACRRCRTQKVRCDGSQPCERCRKARADCVFASPGEPGPSSGGTSHRQRTQPYPSGRQGHTHQDDLEGTRPPTPTLDLGPSIPTSMRISRSPIASPALPTSHVSPPFSTFLYAPQAVPEPAVPDVLVPPCAQPFPEMRDPIECGIVSVALAEWLFDFYQANILPLIPLFHLDFSTTRHRSPFLLSAVLSIAYVNTPLDMALLDSPPPGVLADPRTADLLTNLALNYLADSLLRRIVHVEDSVAVLNMALFNQRRHAARGPSSWPLIGHAQRIAKRIFIQDAPPVSDEWIINASLDTFDHFYTLGYSRPLPTDRPPPYEPSSDPILLASTQPSLAPVVAQHELVQSIRHLVRWLSHQTTHDEHVLSLSTLLSRLNDDLDAWTFRWTSPASLVGTLLPSSSAGALAITLILANHVRLCLNMLPFQSSSRATDLPHSDLARSHRLALSAAVETVELFRRDFESAVVPMASLRYAPGIIGSILAHAALSLSPSSPLARYQSERAQHGSAATEKYFELALDLMKSDKSNQGHFTPTFARTLEAVIARASRPDFTDEADPLASRPPTSGSQLWDNFNFDAAGSVGLMGYFGGETTWNIDELLSSM